MRTWIFTFIFQLVLCVYLTEEVKVKFKRKRGSYINGINFYSSTDHFDSIGSTQNYRLQFCIKLNGICEGNTCNQCRCRKQDSTFISYSLGCRNDYFKGIKTSNYLYYMKVREKQKYITISVLLEMLMKFYSFSAFFAGISK